MFWFLLHIFEWCSVLLEISREIHNTSSDENTAMIDRRDALFFALFSVGLFVY